MLMYGPKNISTAPKPPGEVKVIADEGERNREAAKLLRAYWDEGADSATIAALFDELYTHQSYRKMLPYYVAQGDAAAYAAAMNGLPDSDTDAHQFKLLQALHWQINQSGRTYMQLTAEEESLVRQIAHSDSRAAFEAHALLYLLYGEEFEVALPLLPNDIAAMVGTNNLGTIAFKATDGDANVLKISPNPASSSVVIAALPQGKSGHIQLYGIDGRLSHTANLDDSGSLELDLGAFGNGIYVLRLQLSDGTTVYQKLIVAR